MEDMYQTGKNGWWKHWDFIMLDLFSLQAAYIISFMLRHGIVFPYEWEAYRSMGLIIVFVELSTSFFLENYKDIIRRGYFEEFKQTILQITAIVLILFTYMFLSKNSATYSRVVFMQMWILGMFFTYLVRWLWKIHLRKKLTNIEYLQKMVLVATLDNARDFLNAFEQETYKNFYVSGIILLDGATESEIHGIPVIGSGKSAIDVLQKDVVDEVFIDGTQKNLEVSRILKACKEMGITTHYSWGKSQNIAGSVVEEIVGYTVITSSIKFADQRQVFLKRLMDITGGVVGVTFTGILTVILGPIIYIQSPGPIFFSQKRVGRNGRIFKIYKFRSMYPDAEERKKELMKENKMQGLMFKMDNDPRIIPIGKFIRKTSLDEFPQFFNVLKGDMSLVGTRPPTVDEYEQYERHHMVRLAAKPGLTGMWQVSGRSDIVDFEEVVALDKKYIEEWNIGMDFKILLQTIKVVLTGKGSV